MPRHFRNQFIFILFGVAKSGKSLFANILYNKLVKDFPMDKCIVLNKDDMNPEVAEGAANATFLRDIRAASNEREHSFIIIDDLNLTLDQIAAILMVVDNHPRTGVLLIDMGKPPEGVLVQRRGFRNVWHPDYQEDAYSLTKSKLPRSLPIYKIKSPSHFMWTPTVQNVAEKRKIYEDLAYQLKEHAAAEIIEMIKTNPGGFSYHIFDNKTQRDTFFKDLIIDGFLKRSRFSYTHEVAEDKSFFNDCRFSKPFKPWGDFCTPLKMKKSWADEPDNNEPLGKINLPKLNLCSTSTADPKKAEEDEMDGEWISLLSGEPTLTATDRKKEEVEEKKKDPVLIDLTKSSSGIPTPVITDEEKEEDDDEDKIAEKMVMSLLSDKEENKLSTPKI